MILLFYIRTFVAYAFGLRKEAIVAWRSTLSPFSFRFGRGRERSFSEVFRWCRVALGIILRKRPAPARPTRSWLAVEDVPGEGEGRKNYVEARVGEPCDFLAMNELAPTSTGQRIGLLLQVAVLYLFLAPLILFSGRRRASIGLVPVDFVRLCLLVRSMERGPVRNIVWFHGYEKGTALLVLYLIEHGGQKVRIVPSPNPIRNFYTHVVASTFVFTIPFHQDEYRVLRDGWAVEGTDSWPMYRTERIRAVAGRTTEPGTVGFVSSGNWLRGRIGKNQIGADFDANEEEAMRWCVAFAKARPGTTMKVFLHPLERRPEFLEDSMQHFLDLGVDAEAIQTNVPMGLHPEKMDVAVALYSSALLERLHAGYKAIYAQPGMPPDYFMSGAITGLIASDEAAFHALLERTLACSAQEFFARPGLAAYGLGPPSP